MTYNRPSEEPIAIVGSGCRFPGDVTSTSKLWELLEAPYDLSREVPKNRFNIAGFYHPDGEYHGTTNSPKAYWIEQDHRLFDAPFFNITPKEAEAIDPQHKMLLEVVHEAMDSAGIPIKRFSGKKVSCFIGSMTADFDGLTQKDVETSSQYAATGTSRAIISNRISYFFNWKGASMTIDTACSSSLVALHQAILGLRNGEAEAACVGGANVMLSPENYIAEASLHMLSPSGKSRMWDINADGYARGEGVAAVILKTLSRALADGDNIEGIVRASGVNSNGRGQGITMPSSELQAALINDTFRGSGLDPTNPLDMPQYFEAHGTGTQAGDPREAGAICQAFFGDPASSDGEAHATTADIIVGSVKTIIGHTEGAAGLAGLLKVILSMKHQRIPPNQHFETLNPSVAVSCKHLKVPTILTEWPSPPPGQPCRASVNSFGFGGTNAHAILERYEPNIHDSCVGWQTKKGGPGPAMPNLSLPLILSAASEKSLADTVQHYAAWLKNNPSIDLLNLSWTLACRRTLLSQKITFTGMSQDDLIIKMENQLKKFSEGPGAGIGQRSKQINRSAHILGIFTGQGAQWPLMSRELLNCSQLFRGSIQKMQRVLEDCPDPPPWSLEEELKAPPKESRLNEAAFSQPLCTAVQVGLVDLLKASGVSFYGVVGHSSGEIAAAYAANRISAKTAILIAYYRGLHAKLAGGPENSEGRMLAAGIGVEEAVNFCNQANYKGRVYVAASNAPTSVTLSGDKEAIDDAKADLDGQGKFVRILQVDTAYHSHHMDRCSKPYTESLERCHIITEQPDDTCLWVSSVYGPSGTPSANELSGRYWRENMVQAVLFSEALERILIHRGPFDAAIEVGPHAALKGPVTQTMKAVLGNAIPYIGTLDRTKNDVLALGECLAFLCTLPVAASVDLKAYAKTFGGHILERPEVVKDLPPYCWDHSQRYYRESRFVRQYLGRTARPNELLGVPTPDSSSQELRWRNIIKPSAIPWLKDHRFQGRIIVPAAAYCVMALDAARYLAGEQPTQVVELQALEIFNAISAEEDSQGIECIFTLIPNSEVRNLRGVDVIEANFLLSSTTVDGNLPMKKAVGGRISIVLGKPRPDLLPSRCGDKYGMNAVDLDDFYASMLDVGLSYTGSFRALTSLSRRLNTSEATLQKPHPMDPSELRVSPSFLDVCFQAAFAAFAAPSDGSLWTAFLPQKIERIRFNLALCDVNPGTTVPMGIDAYITRICPTTSQSKASFTGDVEIFNEHGQMEIQVEGINVASFAAQAKVDDRELFLKTVWRIDPESAFPAVDSTQVSVDHELIDRCRRMIQFYLTVDKPHSLSVGPWPLETHPVDGFDTWSSCSGITSSDTAESIDRLIKDSPYQKMLSSLKICAEDMPSMLPGMVGQLIQDAAALSKLNHQLASVVRQISHRYPRMNIMEIASDEMTTTSMLRSLGSAFALFTVAGVDQDFYERVLKSVDGAHGKVTRSDLDIEQESLVQGYIAQSYDLVIISYAARKTSSVEAALKRLSQLIRPGGYLIILDFMVETFKDKLARCISPLSARSEFITVEWDVVLAGAGLTPRQTFEQSEGGLSLIISQVNDDCSDLLRRPLEVHNHQSFMGSVLLVGGKRPAVKALAQQITKSLVHWSGQIIQTVSLEEIPPETFDNLKATVILADLDESVIATMTERKLKALQSIFSPNRQVLWLVSGFRENNPYHNASVGLGRCITAETPQLDLQFLDLDVIEGSGELVAEAFLRLVLRTSADLQDRLWTTEHEIILENSQFLIPRILPAELLNDRLNSVRRVVTKDISTADSVVEIIGTEVAGGTRHIATAHSAIKHVQNPTNQVKVRLDYSSLYAIKSGASSYSYICTGQETSSGRLVIAFSPTNSSLIQVPSSHTQELKGDIAQTAALLALVVSYYICCHAPVHDQPGTIILNEPDEYTAFAFEDLLSTGRRLLCFTSDHHQSEAHPGWIYVNPLITSRQFGSLLPANVVCVLDFSPKDNAISSVLRNGISAQAQYLPRSSLFESGKFTSNEDIMVAPGALQEAVRWSEQALRSSPSLRHRASTTQIRQIMENDHNPPLTIAEWSRALSVPKLQLPVEPSTVFSSSKTYLLVGLTGELGQSLCKLMVESGVRYLVVVSRNPDKYPKWQTELETKGAKVMIEAVDVAKIEDVLRLRDRMSEAMPPVVGVVNGAMVLSDGLFEDMSYESFQKVLRPKVDGSAILDRVFSSVDLDFFVMFSSLTAITGNRGQGNYAAANMFMAGLAAQRRKRGVAGSVLDIGMLYGIGYINRTEGTEIYSNLRKQGYRPISERDIHHMFIEAIVAGYPGSDVDAELITGLQRYSLTDKQPLNWHSNPRFAHHTVADRYSFEADAESTTISVRSQLRQATSTEDAATKLRRCFAAHLEVMLKLPKDSVKHDVSIIELGVDSLVAVEIRSWFIKEVNKDMPVLKVLGGSTLGELCDDLAPEVFAENASISEEVDSDAADLADGSSSAKTSSGDSGSIGTPLTAYSDNEFDDDELPEVTDRLYQTSTQMSYGQARLWFPYVYLEDKTAYNTTTSYTMKGALNVNRFEKAVESVIRRHQVFRMSFFTNASSGHSIQAVSSKSPFVLKKIPSADEGKDLIRETEYIENHHYDLESGDVFIATLLTHEPEKHTIIFGYHHIILDAVSWQLFLQDLETFYRACDTTLDPASKFTDFAIKQRRLMESGGAQDKRDYWRTEFTDLPPTLPLFPFSKVSSRKNMQRYDTVESFTLLDPSLVAKVKQASTAAKTTTFHFYLSVLQVLLHKTLDIHDVCIGITDANRTDSTFMQTIGFLLDSLPLRFQIRKDESFIDRLQDTRSKVYAALGNSGVPLDVILDDLNAADGSETLPLFQILVNYRMGALKQKSMGDIQLDFLAYKDAKHPFDFILSIDEDEGAGGLTLSMQEYLYDRAGGDLILQTFVYLLDAFTSDVSQKLNASSSFHGRQRQPALALSQGPQLTHDWPATISLRVDQMVQSNPESIAIQDSTAALTYRQMAARIDAIALRLDINQNEKGSRVAVCLEPCADLICSLLAILRLGAVYIPLDVRNSDERLSAIIEESSAQIVVTHELTRGRVEALRSGGSKIVEISAADTSYTKAVPNRSRGPDPAFIMFTSGSTGKPKGIVLTNTNMLTHVVAATERMSIGKERVLQQSAFGYDASLAQIFYALANGGTLVLSSNQREMSHIADLMEREKITFTLCAPSEYTVLFKYGGPILARCASWRTAMCGGEVFPSHLKSKFFDLAIPDLRVFNAYGPTEISVASNIGLVDYLQSDQHDAQVSIGRPLPNYASYILESNLDLVPPGWPGEICVAGPAVAMGYLQNPNLTKSKFITKSISYTGIEAGIESIIYRTGDKGRLLADGSIEYRGRIDGDTQVKLRGIRVELDDIASTMVNSSQKVIVNAAVVVRGEDQTLIAYVVFDCQRAPTDPAAHLQQYVLDLPLPAYMRPAVAIPLDELPMTASGKLDVKCLQQLPLPLMAGPHVGSVALTETESKVKEIWEDVLPYTGLAIGKSSNFFSVGGNSLLLLALQAGIRNAFDQDITLFELFQTNTLGAMALRLQRNNGHHSDGITISPTPALDWVAETSLSSALISSVEAKQSTKVRRGPLNVVLTGATGFLGRSILRSLAVNKGILHINCVATRPTEANISYTMSNESPKVTYYMGDLSAERLGLSEEEARLLFADADVVIHNGADVSFMKTYDSLRAPNLAATKELVTAVAGRSVPFHYISTAGIAHLSDTDCFDESSAAELLPPTDGSDGYVASKWASERYLENANAHLELPVWIYRPSSITGPNAPAMDIMQNVLKFSRVLHAIPDLRGWQGCFDYVDVESVAAGIVKTVIANRPRPSMTGVKGVEYFHASGGRVVPVDKVKEALEEETGSEIQVLGMKDWAAAAREQGMEELVAMYLASLVETAHMPRLPRLKSRWRHC